LAPTSVAAINIAGQTVHSFFGFKLEITVSKVKKKYRIVRKHKMYKKLDTVVIDEISMVRADLLDLDRGTFAHGQSYEINARH